MENLTRCRSLFFYHCILIKNIHLPSVHLFIIKKFQILKCEEEKTKDLYLMRFSIAAYSKAPGCSNVSEAWAEQTNMSHTLFEAKVFVKISLFLVVPSGAKSYYLNKYILFYQNV